MLFESENSINTIKGFSSNYVRVENIYIPELANNFNTVKILEVNSDICKGEIMGINKPVDLLEG